MKAVDVTAIHIAMLCVQPNFQLMNVPVFTKCCMHIMLLDHTTILYILICNVSNNNIGNILME